MSPLPAVRQCPTHNCDSTCTFVSKKTTPIIRIAPRDAVTHTHTHGERQAVRNSLRGLRYTSTIRMRQHQCAGSSGESPSSSWPCRCLPCNMNIRTLDTQDTTGTHDRLIQLSVRVLRSLGWRTPRAEPRLTLVIVHKREIHYMDTAHVQAVHSRQEPRRATWLVPLLSPCTYLYC